VRSEALSLVMKLRSDSVTRRKSAREMLRVRKKNAGSAVASSVSASRAVAGEKKGGSSPVVKQALSEEVEALP